MCVSIVPNDIKNTILLAISAYEHDRELNDKKSILLMPWSSCFLYGNRFCMIRDFELEFVSENCQVQGGTVQKPIFLSIQQDGFYAVGEQPVISAFVSLIFHIDFGNDDELLRGILLSTMGETRFALFCDPAIEELYRLTRKTNAYPNALIVPAEDLRQISETLRRNDLHGLAELYLKGQPLRKLFDYDFSRRTLIDMIK